MKTNIPTMLFVMIIVSVLAAQASAYCSFFAVGERCSNDYMGVTEQYCTGGYIDASSTTAYRETQRCSADTYCSASAADCVPCTSGSLDIPGYFAFEGVCGAECSYRAPSSGWFSSSPGGPVTGTCPTGEVCNMDGVCVDCLDDSHCTEKELCQNNRCVAVECKQNSHCGDKELCNTETHRCYQVECVQDAHCSNPSFPYCRTDTNECVECLVKKERQPGYSIIPRYQDVVYGCTVDTMCDQSINECVQCFSDADCGVGLHCSVTTGQCVDCQDDADCGISHMCLSHTCVAVECVNDNDCITTYGGGTCGAEHTCEGFADIVLTDIEFAGEIYNGVSVPVTLLVENRGDEPVSRIRIRFQTEAYDIGEQTHRFSPLLFTETEREIQLLMTLNDPAPTRVDRTLTVALTNDAGHEKNTQNNVRSLDITVDVPHQVNTSDESESTSPPAPPEVVPVVTCDPMCPQGRECVNGVCLGECGNHYERVDGMCRCKPEFTCTEESFVPICINPKHQRVCYNGCMEDVRCRSGARCADATCVQNAPTTERIRTTCDTSPECATGQSHCRGEIAFQCIRTSSGCYELERDNCARRGKTCQNGRCVSESHSVITDVHGRRRIEFENVNDVRERIAASGSAGRLVARGVTGTSSNYYIYTEGNEIPYGIYICLDEDESSIVKCVQKNKGITIRYAELSEEGTTYALPGYESVTVKRIPGGVVVEGLEKRSE